VAWEARVVEVCVTVTVATSVFEEIPAPPDVLEIEVDALWEVDVEVLACRPEFTAR